LTLSIQPTVNTVKSLRQLIILTVEVACLYVW